MIGALKLLLAVVVGLVGAAIVHILVVFAIPAQSRGDGWSRLERLGPLFATVPVTGLSAGEAAPDAGTEGTAFGFVDPAFLTVACRFTTETGPVRLLATEKTPFWSASISARNGDNLYSISERVALDGRLDLLVGEREQLDLARLEGTPADPVTIPVEFAAEEGILVVRALVAEESQRPFVDRFARSVACRPATAEEAGRTAP